MVTQGLTSHILTCIITSFLMRSNIRLKSRRPASATPISRGSRPARGRPRCARSGTLARQLGVTPEYLETGVDIPRPSIGAPPVGRRAQIWARRPQRRGAGRSKWVLRDATGAAEADLVIRAQVALGLASLGAGNRPRRDRVPRCGRGIATHVATHSSECLHQSQQGLSIHGCPRKRGGVAGCRPGRADRAGAGRCRRPSSSIDISDLCLDRRHTLSAREVIRESANDAATADPRSQVRLIWSLARLTAVEGRPRTAVREMRRAISLLDLTEDSLELARAHLFCVEASLFGAATSRPPRLISRPASRLKRLPADERDLAALMSCEGLLLARHRSFGKLARRRSRPWRSSPTPRPSRASPCSPSASPPPPSEAIAMSSSIFVV